MSEKIFELTFPKANKEALCTGEIRQNNSDFFVEELMDVDLAGEGEHTWIYAEKCGENTDFIARKLAKHAGVRLMDVGFSGLKDRHAVTKQWFSVYLGTLPEPDWASLNDETLTIISHQRHTHKLRRGQHQANRFVIIVRDVKGDLASLESALQLVHTQGFPNYFGEQRFGRNGANLDRAVAMFEKKTKVDKNKRGFYLSAARSFIFNRVLAERILANSWQQAPEDGPMYGELPRDISQNIECSPEHVGCSPLEQQIFAQYPEITKGLYANRLKMEPRKLAIHPKKMTWQLKDNTLELAFELSTGSFATSLLSELLNYRVFRRSDWEEKTKKEE